MSLVPALVPMLSQEDALRSLHEETKQLRTIMERVHERVTSPTASHVSSSPVAGLQLGSDFGDGDLRGYPADYLATGRPYTHSECAAAAQLPFMLLSKLAPQRVDGAS
jgi:hypothetical protein